MSCCKPVRLQEYRLHRTSHAVIVLEHACQQMPCKQSLCHIRCHVKSRTDDSSAYASLGSPRKLLMNGSDVLGTLDTPTSLHTSGFPSARAQA